MEFSFGKFFLNNDGMICLTQIANPLKDIQGNILGGYYIGYIMTQIFGAWLARKIGSVKVLAASMTIG